MNLNEPSPNMWRPDNKISSGKNANPKPSNLSETITGNDEVSVNQYLMRLMELEERNAYQENLIEQRSQEIAGINRKYISFISHTLRGPYSAVLVVLKLLKERLKDYDLTKIQEFISIASDSRMGTFNLLDELLAWGISQYTEDSFNPIKINLHELLKEEIDSIYRSARNKQRVLNQSVSPNMNVTADPQMLKAIFKNLIDNAIEFTDVDGEITIRALECKPFIHVEVIDNGIGISQEDQQNLFKIDAIDSSTCTNNEKGKGLSLVLCKEFISIHGGNIWLESEPGKGSKFNFTLPHYA